MTNPVPPPDGTYPPPGPGGYPAPRYPAPGQGGYSAAGQGGYPAPEQGGYAAAPGQGGYGAPSQPGYPPSQGGYPAPGQGGYAAPGQAPYPPSTQGQPPTQGQPQYPSPGQWQPSYPGQPQYGPADHGFPPPEAGQPPYPGETKKGGRRLLIVALFVLVLVVIGGLRFALANRGDNTKDAKAGDCLSAAKDPSQGQVTKTTADVVDCGSADAKFTVVARVEGESDVESDACTKYFKAGENFFVYASKGGGSDYLLCLRPA